MIIENFAKHAPLPLFLFLWYINKIYHQRTDFSYKIDIEEKYALSKVEILKKIKFSSCSFFT